MLERHTNPHHLFKITVSNTRMLRASLTGPNFTHLKMQQEPDSRNTDAHNIFSLDKLAIGLLIYAYATLISASYLLGFWRALGFDIFPYATPTDYINSTLNRLILVFILPMLFGFVIYFANPYEKFGRIKTLLVYITGCSTMSIGKNLYDIKTSPYRILFNNEQSVILVSCISIIIIALTLKHIWKEKESKAILYLALACAVLSQIIASMTSGYQDGKDTYHSRRPLRQLLNSDICDKDSKKRWAYLGKYSDKAFFLEVSEKTLCITESKFMRIDSKHTN